MLIKRMLILTIVLCLTMLSIGCPVAAANEKPLERTAIAKAIAFPMSVYINSIYTNLTISSSGTATAYGYVNGTFGLVDQVWIYLYLEKYINGYWTIISSWSQHFDSNYGSLVRTASVMSGFNYRVRANYYVYSGDNSERTAQYSSTIYY
jgi:hypothetical protein